MFDNQSCDRDISIDITVAGHISFILDCHMVTFAYFGQHHGPEEACCISNCRFFL